MEIKDKSFDLHKLLQEMKHFLPAQAPLKDFIHHNTLHAFQDQEFHTALRSASGIFGYKSSFSIDEYRVLFREGRIREDILDKVLMERKLPGSLHHWKQKMLHDSYELPSSPRIGQLRAQWKKQFRVDLDSLVHPTLFRILCSYLDQGISVWSFPLRNQGLLASLAEMERNSFSSLFRRKRAKELLIDGHYSTEELLRIVVGDESLYSQYLYDQQFAHQGWSGMVSAVEDQPASLLDTRKISLHELIVLELLLEIDALDFQFGDIWAPLCHKVTKIPPPLFDPVPESESGQLLAMWQDAFEWTYYDQVLAGITISMSQAVSEEPASPKSFQSMFCIDDRELSLRRYLEEFDPSCDTFATSGFFGVEFFYQPENGKFYTKLCPAPLTPKYLIKETGVKEKRKTDPHFTKYSHSFLSGWLISQTLGFWSAFKLFLNIFRPSMSPATASSFRHMDKLAHLSIENKNPEDRENGLQIGFSLEEMARRVESVLKSIGLVKDFAPLIYTIGHGSSSVNNPHFAAYDCGACCGRPGSVNARVFSFMANHSGVRELLAARGLQIPAETQFLGGIHDTTRDEVMFFDEGSLSPANLGRHLQNEKVFEKALDFNAKERSRRFESINTKKSPEKIHNQVRTRSVSLFEPRPELNHATNALCIVGPRKLTRHLFLDRRSFTNSYDYRVDPKGSYLFNILKAAAPVCGGINLEYFFSRVDNQKLGAGTKLPHNVMGLFGVANGSDGDLRPGLPSQMIEVHDPVRLMILVEHFPDIVLKTIQQSPETYEWFKNQWIHLLVLDPQKKELFLFRDGGFIPYAPLTREITTVNDLRPILESEQENFPVYLIA